MNEIHDTNSTLPDSLLSLEAMRLTMDTPWKAINEIERFMLWPMARIQCALAGIGWNAGWKFYGLPIIQKHRRSTMSIGAGMELRSTARSNPLGANRPCILSTRRAGAVLQIGSGFGMTGGSVICEERVIIGDRVIVGANTVITDTDFHPVGVERRRTHFLDGATAAVMIGDDVFIGMSVLILKGVKIGVGSVIGAGSVVTRDVPAGVIAAGNPTKVIKTI
jgi:acetyltransferase-like isoleucine patch superfamily enzyme